MEELLKIAKEKYPVGTVFKSAYSGNILTSTDIPKICITGKDVEVRCENGILAFLYENSTWAKIISKPKVKEEAVPKFKDLKRSNNCTRPSIQIFEEGKAEDPLTNISSVTDPYADFVPGTTQTVRTFGQIKKDNFFKTATESLCKMLEAKNKAYGESALKPLDIFAKHHPYGSRLDEKLARIKNSEELRKNDVADIIGGLFLICKDKGWSDFTDLID